MYERTASGVVANCPSGVGIRHKNAGERCERRIEHGLPISRFTRIEILESLIDRKLKRVVVREITLNDNSAWLVAAAGAAGNLGQQLKGSFGGAEIGQ